MRLLQVRSLALDALSETDLCVALKMGNDAANRLWEEAIPVSVAAGLCTLTPNL